MKTWRDILGREKQQAYFQEVMQFVQSERTRGVTVFPPQADVFNAFKYTSFEELKVVILGQDPYHGDNQAHGLCFSVRKGNPIPPSLRNIYQELQQDINGFAPPSHGDLSHWATQGILLLNTVLTVRKGEANSHRKKGWETFTDRVIQLISEHCEGVVFLLWGSPAQKKTTLIDQRKHHILRSVHPSPLSAHRGFFGCKHFSQTNALLTSQSKRAIDWQIV